MKKTFLERLKAGECLVADGATGTNLQKRGLERGKPGELWLLERPDEILRLHHEFMDAGADILLTCTFGGSVLRLQKEGLGEQVEALNQKAVELAQQATEGTDCLVAGSIGPCGELLMPLGTLGEETAFKALLQQAQVLVSAGVDLLVVETQYDLKEATLAVKAALEAAAGNIPVVCSFSYDRGVRTMMGVNPSQMAKEFAASGVVALGINCGRSLDDNLKALGELKQASILPVWFKPNAGLPTLNPVGEAVYDVTPQKMGEAAAAWLAGGAQIVGGCCGTSPAHLREIARQVKG